MAGSSDVVFYKHDCPSSHTVRWIVESDCNRECLTDSCSQI